MEEIPHQNHSIAFSNPTTSAFLRKIKEHAPTLLISGSILLLLTGLTVTATVLCIIFFSPLILFTSPIWFPIGAFLFVVTAGFMSLCGFGGAVVAGLSWIYRYFRGMHPPGSDQFDNGRSWIYDTASHVKDHATRYGGYLQSKEKLDSDSAPPAQKIWGATTLTALDMRRFYNLREARELNYKRRPDMFLQLNYFEDTGRFQRFPQ